MFDGKAFGKEIVDIVKAHVDKTVAPLLSRIEAMGLEIETLKARPAPKEIDLSEINENMANLRKAVGSMPLQFPEPPVLPDIPAMIAEAIEAAKPEPVDVKALVDEAVAAIERPQDGKDADPELVAALVKETVERAVAALPVPKDGKSVDVEEFYSFMDARMGERVQIAVAAIPVPKNGKDGLDAVKFLRGDKGNLLVTMSNGTVEDLGEIDGRDVDMVAVERSIAEKVAALPKPKDGVDGFGFEDMTEELADDGRTIIRRYSRGEMVKEFRHTMAVVLDRGVYKEGIQYEAGDGVTWGGSFWIAQETTSQKPDSGMGFRLAVKRGRDGKDGVVKPEPPKTPVKVG